MNFFNDRIVEKNNTLKDAIMDNMCSLQIIKFLFTHCADSKKPYLTAEGHTNLSIIGLLRSYGGFCNKCGNARRLKKKLKINRLV